MFLRELPQQNVYGEEREKERELSILLIRYSTKLYRFEQAKMRAINGVSSTKVCQEIISELISHFNINIFRELHHRCSIISRIIFLCDNYIKIIQNNFLTFN